MAINASAVWRVRIGGNDLNGAGYDGVSYPGGTDYSQQDAPQASFSATLSTSASGSTTLLNSGNTFTAAMVGNAIYLASGTNAVAGYYFITAFGNSGSVTVDRAPATAGALSGGTGRVGGAAASPSLLINSGNAAGAKVVPGNVVFIRGSGAASPSTYDYAAPGWFSPVQGDSTNGRVRVIGENGRPGIQFDGLWANNSAMFHIEKLKFICKPSPSFSNRGALDGTYGNNVVRDCILDQNGQDVSLLCNVAGIVVDCEFCNSGSSVAGSNYAFSSGAFGWTLANCNFHDLKGPVISDGSICSQIINNMIVNNGGSAIVRSISGRGDMQGIISGNTIDGNAGHGIDASGGASNFLAQTNVINNIISNHTGTGKAGIYLGGAAATNDRIKGVVDYNNYYNNTTNISGGTASANDVVGTDPGFVSRSTGDYRIGTALKGAGLGGYKQSLSGKVAATSYVDMGAVQRQEPAGGGSVGGPTVVFVG